jgi:hypothetical protein
MATQKAHTTPLPSVSLFFQYYAVIRVGWEGVRRRALLFVPDVGCKG